MNETLFGCWSRQWTNSPTSVELISLWINMNDANTRDRNLFSFFLQNLLRTTDLIMYVAQQFRTDRKGQPKSFPGCSSNRTETESAIRVKYRANVWMASQSQNFLEEAQTICVCLCVFLSACVCVCERDSRKSSASGKRRWRRQLMPLSKQHNKLGKFSSCKTGGYRQGLILGGV